MSEPERHALPRRASGVSQVTATVELLDFSTLNPALASVANADPPGRHVSAAAPQVAEAVPVAILRVVGSPR